jgi:D-alanyl-D-alanine dipeptidase
MTRTRRRFLGAVIGCLLISGTAAPAVRQTASPPDWERILTDLGLVDVQTVCEEIQVELKYSTPDNFLHRDVYGDLERCFLLKEAASKLAAAQKSLAGLRPGWRLKVWDGARPRRIQAAMWALVKGTPQQPFVANPVTGSIHNFGAAVDLTLIDEKGRELDMGTPYDFFGDKAQPRLEDELLKTGQLTPAQVENRRFLRKIMTEAGFISISSEWWHFDAFPKEEVRKRFKIIE